MSEKEPGGFVVTSKMMYDKLVEVDHKVTVLMERDQRDHERMKELETSVKWLTRAVYAIGAPLVIIISGYEAVTRIWL